MNRLRAEAEKLREQGYSYTLINQKLGVSKGTMSYWFKDKPFKPNKIVRERIKNGPMISGIRRHNERVKEIENLKNKGIQEIGKLSKRDLWILGVGLYIGEGAKTTEIIRIINSDPTVIAIAIKWLKECCGLDDSNITIAIHIYPDNNEEDSINFWQDVTGLPGSNFRKTQIDRRIKKSSNRSGKLPHGTAHITVVSNGEKKKGVQLYRRINGWMIGVLNQI